MRQEGGCALLSLFPLHLKAHTNMYRSPHVGGLR